MKGMKPRYWFILVFAGLIFLAYQYFRTCSYPSVDVVGKSDQVKNFDRSTSHLIYTKHARCRMDCRRIDESEVKEILKKGEINYSKSFPNRKTDPTYALEGITYDGQHVRIIFAPRKAGMVVITCIDLGKNWKCNCN